MPEYVLVNVGARLLTDTVLATNYTWIPSVINVGWHEIIKDVSLCSMQFKRKDMSSGRQIHLWFTLNDKKGIMVLPMPICLTDPTLWRKWITLQVDYLVVILELQYIYYDRQAVLFWSLSVTFVYSLPWWRHQMETLSASLALCAGNSPVTGELPSQRPVTRGFDVFFDLRLNKRLSI